MSWGGSKLAAVAVGVAVGALVSLTIAARAVVATDFWGTSYVVIVAGLMASASLVIASRALGDGWVLLRRAVVLLALLVGAYPGWWAAAAIADDIAPWSRGSWALLVLAGTGHLPMIAAFSLLPLLAVRYLGRGATRRPAQFVLMLGAAALASFVLFFDEFDPFRAEALVASESGAMVGMVVTLAFLATVLLGPAVPLIVMRRSDERAARRLALVAVSALAGAGLVMLCGAVGSATSAGSVALIVGMDLAVVVVALGTCRALTTTEVSDVVGSGVGAPPVEQSAAQVASDRPTIGVLTPREAEVLGLLCAGLSNAGIAARLVLSERTVDAHLRSVFTKLDLPDGPLENRRVHAVLAWKAASQTAPSAS